MPSLRFGLVVGVDGSPRSTVAVSWATRDAELRNVPLTLVHAAPRSWADPPAWAFGWPKLRRVRRILDDALAVVDTSCRTAGPPEVITKVARADPVAALVELSREAELLVVGGSRPHGAGPVRRLLSGSVSSRLVDRAQCAVAVIHDEDPLMPHPAQAPVLVGVGGATTGRAADHARGEARREAARRGVIVVEVPEARLAQESDRAQLTVVGDRTAGAAITRAARMPVIVTG
ncbi:MAG: universal stress protein [Mycobacterium sp.]